MLTNDHLQTETFIEDVFSLRMLFKFHPYSSKHHSCLQIKMKHFNMKFQDIKSGLKIKTTIMNGLKVIF